MADRENKFWNRIVEHLWRPTRVLNRVENGVLDGMPDAYYTIDGLSGWMELKVPIEPARPSTPLFGSNHKLSVSQRNWLLAHRQAGGVGWVEIETESCMMLIGARHADKVNHLTLAQLIAIADFAAQRPVQDQDWEKFVKTLAYPYTACNEDLP